MLGTLLQSLRFLGGQARGAKESRKQAYALPSGARNPIVIVKIFIYIFLRLKVVLQAKPVQERAMQFGELVQTPAHISDTKNYIYLPAGGTVTYKNTFLPVTHTP